VAVPELLIRNLSREFSSGAGLHDISLEVEAGEFFVLLGPSGCGKSTLLRLIAGLEPADRGIVDIAGTHAGYGARNGAVAMVFQNYALYPHMTAFDNIAFPLRLMKLGREEIRRRVEACARSAGLSTALNRRPAELSGGERQRVALARALVREPRIILMDEPLSNLDAQLRASLRVELKRFQRDTGRTVIYVTHDQLEALTLADRLAVMRAGTIEQIGSPRALYDAPANEFVASFVGQPPMNLVRVRVAPDRKTLCAGEAMLRVEPPAAARDEVIFGIRPEDLSLDAGPAKSAIETTIERVEFSGARYSVVARFGPAYLLTETAEPLQAGERRRFYFERSRVHFFDASSGRRLPRVDSSPG